MSNELKRYIVTARSFQDLDSLYDDMESPGGDLYIPNRTVDLALRRPTSRNTEYYLTESEAQTLKNDRRVLAVESYDLLSSTTKITFDWTDVNGIYTKAAPPPVAGRKNWGLLRHIEKKNSDVFNWHATTTPERTTTLYSPLDGKNVDVIVSDAGQIEKNHPEFALNSDGSGGTRVQEIDWYLYTSSLGFGGVYPTSGYNYVSTSANNHPTKVASILAGNTQGWARKSNIYNISFEKISDIHMWDYIKYWHQNKSVNAQTGDKNPTIVNASWGQGWTPSIAQIDSVLWRGTTYLAPLSSTDLRNFGLVYFPSGLVYIPSYSTSIAADIEDMADAGVIFVTAAGNSSFKQDIVGGIDYDNQITWTDGTTSTEYYHRGFTNTAAPKSFSIGAIRANSPEGKADFSVTGPRIDAWAAGAYVTLANLISATGVADTRDTNYGFETSDGTSFAAPQIAGILALIAEAKRNIDYDTANTLLSYYGYQGDELEDIGSTGGYTDYYSLQGAPNLIAGYNPPTFAISDTTSTLIRTLYTGDTITYTINTSNIPDGSSIYVTDVGTANANVSLFTDGANAFVETVSSNISIFTRTLSGPITSSYTSQVTIRTGGYDGTIQLTSDSINLSPPATYTVTPNKASVYEGGNVIFQINTANVPSGTNLYWTLDGANLSDFERSSGLVQIINGAANVQANVVVDGAPESESFRLQLRKNNISGSIVANSTFVNILDIVSTTTAYPVDATFNLYQSKSIVDEGSSVVISLITTKVPNNTLIPYEISGMTGYSGFGYADITGYTSSGNLVGNLLVVSNAASLILPIKADETTEGDENFKFALTGSGRTEYLIVNINDTSPSPGQKRFFITMSGSSGNTTREGSLVSVYIRAIDVRGGTIIPYNILGITANDLADPSQISGSFILYNRLDYNRIYKANFSLSEWPDNEVRGYVELLIASDATTESSETLIFLISPDFPYVLELSSTVTVQDTSQDDDVTTTLAWNTSILFEGSTANLTIVSYEDQKNDIVEFALVPTSDSLPQNRISLDDFEGYRYRTTKYNSATQNYDVVITPTVPFILKEEKITGYFPPLGAEFRLDGGPLGATVEVLARDDFKFEQSEYFYAVLTDGRIVASQTVELRDSGNTFKEDNFPYTGNVSLRFLDKALLFAEIGGVHIGNPDWLDSAGRLSETMYLQGRTIYAGEEDPIFYQPFSYVIRSKRSIEEWENSVKKLLHPGGFALFSEINNETEITDVLNVSLKPANSIIAVSGAAIGDDSEYKAFVAITSDTDKIKVNDSRYLTTRVDLLLTADGGFYVLTLEDS